MSHSPSTRSPKSFPSSLTLSIEGSPADPSIGGHSSLTYLSSLIMSLPAVRGAVSLLGEGSWSQLLSHFPPRITYAFAYGSAVFAQKGQTTGKVSISCLSRSNIQKVTHSLFYPQMVDIVLVVDSPVSWHTANLVLNPSHYSALRYLGPALITRIQERMASGVYYNPFVRIGDQVRELLTKLFDNLVLSECLILTCS